MPIDHLETNDDEQRSQCRHRHPRNDRSQQQYGQQRPHALKHTRQIGGAAAGLVHQGGSHGARTRCATNEGRGQVTQALANELFIRVVA